MVIRHCAATAASKRINSLRDAASFHIAGAVFYLLLASSEYNPLPGSDGCTAGGAVALTKPAFNARVNDWMDLL